MRINKNVLFLAGAAAIALTTAFAPSAAVAGGYHHHKPPKVEVSYKVVWSKTLVTEGVDYWTGSNGSPKTSLPGGDTCETNIAMDASCLKWKQNYGAITRPTDRMLVEVDDTYECKAKVKKTVKFGWKKFESYFWKVSPGECKHHSRPRRH